MSLLKEAFNAGFQDEVVSPIKGLPPSEAANRILPEDESNAALTTGIGATAGLGVGGLSGGMLNKNRVDPKINRLHDLFEAYPVEEQGSYRLPTYSDYDEFADSNRVVHADDLEEQMSRLKLKKQLNRYGIPLAAAVSGAGLGYLAG